MEHSLDDILLSNRLQLKQPITTVFGPRINKLNNEIIK